jgi:hypothetical protein
LTPGECVFALRPTSIKKGVAMKSSVTTFVTTLALLAGALALNLPSASFAQSRGNACIPHYDSSGAQTHGGTKRAPLSISTQETERTAQSSR